MTAMSQALSAALLHFVWQGTVVAFLLWIALVSLRNRTANARYAASCAGMALMAALPAVTALVVYQRPAALSPSVAIVSAIPLAVKSMGVAPRALLAVAQDWALPIWAAGVLLFALRLALSYRHVAVLRRAGEAAEGSVFDIAAAVARRMSIARPVRVLVSKLADSPSVVGWLRPAVLLPAAALTGLDAEQLEAILAHEMAHIRRHDFAVNVLQTVVETLLFYHPAAWWVSARIRHERELCCDDLAVRHCGDAIRYARALTKLERMRAMPQPAVAANGGSLLYRIQRLTGAVRECAPSRLPVFLAVIAVAVCVPLTVHRAHAQQQTDKAANYFFMPQTELQGRTVTLQGSTVTVAKGDMAVEYPESAVRRGVTGTVLVEATLDAEGNVVDAHVLTGPLELRKAALRSVLEASFANATAGEVRQVNIEFTPQALASQRIRQDKEQSVAGMLMRGDLAETPSDEQLRAQIAELQQKLEQIKLPQTEERQERAKAAFESSGDIILRQLQEELARMRKLLGPRNPEIVTLQARIEAIQKQIARELAGRKLVRIDGASLPAGIQLPVQLGDVLTPESMNAVTAAVKAADPNLTVQFLIAGEGEIAIRITR